MQLYLKLLTESSVPKLGVGFFIKLLPAYIGQLEACKFRCDPNMFFFIPVILHYMPPNVLFLTGSIMLRCYFHVVLEFASFEDILVCMLKCCNLPIFYCNLMVATLRNYFPMKFSLYSSASPLTKKFSNCK